MTRTSLITTGTVLLALAAPLLTTTAAHAQFGITAKKICKRHFANGIGVPHIHQATAVMSARHVWKRRVTVAYGPRWATFAKAQKKSTKCKRHGLMWKCTVRARPCR